MRPEASLSMEWREREVRLLFAAGTHALFALRLRVWIHEWTLPELLLADPPSPDIQSLLPGERDGFDLRSMPDALLGAVALEAHRVYAVSRFDRCFVELGVGWEAYQAGFTSKSRSTLRRKIRKFEEFCGHGLDVREYKGAEIETFLPLARTVSAVTYQERDLGMGLPDGDEARQRFERMASQDELRGFLLFCRQEPVAYLLAPAQGDVLLYEYQGYRPDFAQWSPGTLLLWRALELLMREARFDSFDFTEGAGEHKTFFSSRRIPCSNVLVLRDTFKHRALIAAHRAFCGLKRRVKNAREQEVP